MATNEQIKVMQAWVSGKVIQFRNTRGEWKNCAYGIEPLWDWKNCDYRVMPLSESKIRPYKDISEFLKGQIIHGPYVKFKDTVYGIPLTVLMLNGRVHMEFNIPAYADINSIDLLDYTWQDGTPCGIIEYE